MSNNYLDKVIDQIVNETRIDYDRGKVHTPFYVFFLYQDPTYFHHISSYNFIPYSFGENNIDRVMIKGKWV